MSDGSKPDPALPLPERSRAFWLLLRDALILGVVLAFAGLAFLGVTQGGDFWFDSSDHGWLGGSLWWVAVTTGAGIRRRIAA